VSGLHARWPGPGIWLFSKRWLPNQAQEWPPFEQGLLAAPGPIWVLAALVVCQRQEKPGIHACIGPPAMWMGVGGKFSMSGQGQKKRRKPPPGWELCDRMFVPALSGTPPWGGFVLPAFAWAVPPRGLSAVLALSSGDAWSLHVDSPIQRKPTEACQTKWANSRKKKWNDRQDGRTSGPKAW